MYDFRCLVLSCSGVFYLASNLTNALITRQGRQGTHVPVYSAVGPVTKC